MEKLKILKEIRFNILLIIFAFIVTLVAVWGGAFVQEGQEVTVNSVSKKKVKAPREFVNTVKTEANKAEAIEASKKVEPVTERDNTINDKVIENINTFFERAEIKRKEYREKIEQQIKNELAETSEEISLSVPSPTTNSKDEQNLPIHLNDSLTLILMEMSTEDFEKLKTVTTEMTNEILGGGIQEVDTKTLLNIKEDTDSLDLKADYKTLVYEIITSYMEPNIVINVEATNIAKTERAERYKTEYYQKDQTIVDNGDLISEESFAALESLGLVKKESSVNYLLILGALLTLTLLFALTVAYIFVFEKGVITNTKEALLLFTIYTTIILITWLGTSTILSFPFYCVPILIFSMLVAMLFNPKMAVVLNSAVTIVCLMIYNGGIDFLVYFLLAGNFVCLISKFTTERNKIIIAGILTSCVCLLVYFGVTLFFEKGSPETILYQAIGSAIFGLFTVIVTIGTAPFWEAVFGIVTSFRLIDLSNPNSPLLRRLTIEAPGTYHHSLIVANLAESASYDIKANPNLARAIGYYHDIGKMRYPLYFSENQVGENLHDNMDPYDSTKIIISHVSYGIELANKYKLPTAIKDGLSQHHGTTLVKYFYHKAKEQYPHEKVDKADFRYPFDVPKCKESAVVMLADTVEAAVRSVIPKGNSMGEVETLIRTLVKDKIDDGQLLDSNLTIKDIEIVIQSFLRVFKGMYHERIPYPKDEEQLKKKSS